MLAITNDINNLLSVNLARTTKNSNICIRGRLNSSNFKKSNQISRIRNGFENQTRVVQL